MLWPAELTSLAEEAARRALAAGRLIAVAESCTGGMLAASLTEVPGSSSWFLGGIVSYSPDLKRDILCVDPQTIERFGVVSEETALAMAKGLFRTTRCTTAASTTGLAGPAGGGEGLRSGTVCFAWVDGEAGESSATMRFEGGREQVRAAAVKAALEGLLKIG